jgi:methylmalonyl-CoA mutase N-terminal domain/subunit
MNEQLERLRGHRASRDDAAVRRTLDALGAAARDQAADLMPPILDAVRAYATLGEICGSLREVFGGYRPPVSI